MAKPIPDGGKRIHQVKVNFNDLELKKLNYFCKKTGFDKASVLRNAFLEQFNYDTEDPELMMSTAVNNQDFDF
tara:strand:- start:134 stop:352 length:219 start_codon:yes stop_codon:yes gene_type:complete